MKLSSRNPLFISLVCFVAAFVSTASHGGVVINEFMASNSTTLTDEDGIYSDWIELYNPTGQAVNLQGWFLTDDANTLNKWAFPAVTIGAGQYLIVFASDKNTSNPQGELHTNFKLSASGEYLGLIRPDGATVEHAYSPAFPDQITDISFGLGENRVELVNNNSEFAYRVPSSADAATGLTWTYAGFNDAAWATGKGGLGFTSVNDLFQVTVYKSSLTITGLGEAIATVNNPALQTAVYTGQAEVVNFLNTGGNGYFGQDLPFPGLAIGTDVDNFATVITGNIAIPKAGKWTFGLASDSGFLLQLTRGGQTYSIYDAGSNTITTSLSTFDLPEAGIYQLSITYFEMAGGASLELFAASGSFTQFDPNFFRLVGDTANGGLSLGDFDSQIGTNLSGQMKNINASVWSRVYFDVASPADFAALTLEMQYADGFVAYLNGVEVARRNAPSTLAWNSAATATRTTAAASTIEVIDLTSAIVALQTGTNVLAIQGLNNTAADGEFLLRPNLIARRLQPTGTFLLTPTPGGPNAPEVAGFVSEVDFSVPHGFYSSAFPIEIYTETPDAEIRYTTDGSTPSPIHGMIYTGPIVATTTTTLRAVAYKLNWIQSETYTQTYIFLNDVIRQPANPPGYPTVWGPTSADYAMDQRVVNNSAYSGTIINDLKSIPTLSLVTDHAHFFDADTGIYIKTGGTGELWERPVSAEMIDANGVKDFQINCGIRIYGGASRYPQYKKHTFRLFFKSMYGPSKLDFPVYDDADAVTKFDTLILRGSFNDSYTFTSSNATNAQFIRDQWLKDTQLDMGWPSSHGMFVHLYLNGLYWGLYSVSERPDVKFNMAYFGGKEEEWETINAGNPTNDSGEDNWNLANAIALAIRNNQIDPQVGYQQLTALVNLPNLIDYMLINFYAGNTDWDGYNWYAGIRLLDGEGFRFFSWDGEETLRSITGNNQTGTDNSDAPSFLHQTLCRYEEYRVMFADRVQIHFFNGGALTAANAGARYQALVNTVQRAIVGESARWGDTVTSTPRTLNDHWIPQKNWLINSFFPGRGAAVLQQLKSRGLYNDMATPVIRINGVAQLGGNANSGDLLSFTSSIGGTIYYTLDGTDPRAEGGGVAGTAYSNPIPLYQSVTVKARILKSGVWSSLTEASFIIAQSLTGKLVVSELHYHPTNQTPAEATAGFNEDTFFEYLVLTNISSTPVDLVGVYFSAGINFTFPAMLLQPGESVYVANSLAGFAFRYGTSLNVAGEYFGTALSNSGETLTLKDSDSVQIFSFTYGDKSPWPVSADGLGDALYLIDLHGSMNDPANWQAGTPSAEMATVPRIPGDYNEDGVVDLADYTIWADNYGQTGSNLPGDGNGDGVVDLADYTVWADHYGQSVPPQ